MSKSRVMVLGLAIGCAVMAAYLAKGMISDKPKTDVVDAAPKIESEDILIATKSILMGERLAGGSVGWQPWPKDQVREVMITRSEQPDAKEKLAEARARASAFSMANRLSIRSSYNPIRMVSWPQFCRRAIAQLLCGSRKRPAPAASFCRTIGLTGS